tara:strand:- start:3014 stop:4534 length:1521 start_codon:yes stop_codon:yes gene_type:complete
MPYQTTNKTLQESIDITPQGIFFYPSGSYLTPTSSTPPDPASYDIIIPRTISENFITNSGIQPYIKFELVSGSQGQGPRSNPFSPWELYLRFYTSSHFIITRPKSGENDIGTFISTDEYGVRHGSHSLYITSSNNDQVWYRDIDYTQGMTALQLRDAIFNNLTGSSQFILSQISASKHQDEEDPSTGFINHYTCSIHYKQFRGKVTEPIFHTGSLHPDLGTKGKTLRDGTNSTNFVSGGALLEDSASMIMGIDTSDNVSFQMRVATASLAHSGSQLIQRTILYVSGGAGGQGRVGFGTTNPKTKFDIKTDGFKVRSRDGVRELIFEEDGRLSAKKYSGTESSESIGGIIQLSYTPGTFEEPIFAKEGETIGTINWVDESLNKIDLEFAFDDERQKYVTSASVAQITSTIKHASGEGVIGNLEFKVSPIPSGISEYELKGKEGLTSFMEINPILSNAPVYFPYAVSCSSTVYANDLILDYDTLPTSDPSNKGQVYRNSSRQLFISAG